MNSFLLLCLLCVIVGSHAFLLTRPKALSTKRYLFGTPEPPKNQPPAKKGGGLFGDMGNMMDNLKKAQEMAKVYQETMKELAETPITGTDPTGQVTATYTGALIPVSIKFSESIAGSHADVLSAAATQAMLDAYAKAQKEMAAKLKLPGMPGQP